MALLCSLLYTVKIVNKHAVFSPYSNTINFNIHFNLTILLLVDHFDRFLISNNSYQ